MSESWENHLIDVIFSWPVFLLIILVMTGLSIRWLVRVATAPKNVMEAMGVQGRGR